MRNLPNPRHHRGRRYPGREGLCLSRTGPSFAERRPPPWPRTSRFKLLRWHIWCQVTNFALLARRSVRSPASRTASTDAIASSPKTDSRRGCSCALRPAAGRRDPPPPALPRGAVRVLASASILAVCSTGHRRTSLKSMPSAQFCSSRFTASATSRMECSPVRSTTRFTPASSRSSLHHERPSALHATAPC